MFSIINKKTIFRNIKLGLFINDSWKNLSPCDVLLIRHDNDCGYQYQGKAYAHILDSFRDLCTKRLLTVHTIAMPFSMFVGRKAYGSPVSLNQAHLWIEFSRILLLFFKGVEFSSQKANSDRVALWGKILERTRPKVIVGIQPDKYICQAGKIWGIPVYDFQHGVIFENNDWYCFKHRISTPNEELPDGFLCWDEQSASIISQWGKNKEIRTIVTGNLWFSRFVHVDPDDILVHEALEQGNLKVDDRPSILVSLVWGMRTFYPDISCNGVLSPGLEEVILDTIDKYNWILRLHPVQLRGEEKDLTLRYLTETFGEEKTQKWSKSSLFPLPVVLQQIDLHITEFSSVVIEATWMGIRTGLLNQQICNGGDLETLFTHERSTGMAELLPQDPEIISQWISSTLAKGHTEPTLIDFSQNLNTFINEIVTLANHDCL